MGRKIIDCRDFPGSRCTVALSADNEDELINAAVHHAVQVHGHQDTPEFRKELHELVRDEAAQK
ncbi:MAG TPA: DUF1059 domain-containing protein [Magnetospirillum sp.]|nr:DUF1059 domain-containing protein [Magnetospirillum sp.]